MGEKTLRVSSDYKNSSQKFSFLLWIQAVRLVVITLLLVSCGTTPPPLKQNQPKISNPSTRILVDFTPKPKKPFARTEANLRVDAERKGVELFFQDLNGAGTLNGIRFQKTFPPKQRDPEVSLFPCKANHDLKKSSRHKVYCKPQPFTKPKKTVTIPRGRNPIPSQKAKKIPSNYQKKSSGFPQTTSIGTKNDHFAGLYMGKSWKNRKKFSKEMNHLPIVSCSQRAHGNNVTSFSGFDEGAARMALISLKKTSPREIVLVSDNSDFGKRGREIIRRLSEEYELSLRLVTVLSNDPISFLSVFENDPTLPILAWLNQAKLKSLIRAARQIAHTGIILLGPTIIHPNLASRITEDTAIHSSTPLQRNPGETILAVGHKMVVAEQLNDKDPLKRPLKRFRDLSISVFEEPPKLFAACAYDALLFLIEALIRSKHPKNEFTSNLDPITLTRTWKRREFRGLLGSYKISKHSRINHRKAKLSPNSFTLLRAHKTKWIKENITGKQLSGFFNPTHTPTHTLPPSVETSISLEEPQKILPPTIRKF